MIVQRRESRKREKLKCYQNARVFQTPLSHTAIAGITFQLETQKYAVVSEKKSDGMFWECLFGSVAELEGLFPISHDVKVTCMSK